MRKYLGLNSNHKLKACGYTWYLTVFIDTFIPSFS